MSRSGLTIILRLIAGAMAILILCCGQKDNQKSEKETKDFNLINKSLKDSNVSLKTQNDSLLRLFDSTLPQK